jgi:hypothetical protein
LNLINNYTQLYANNRKDGNFGLDFISRLITNSEFSYENASNIGPLSIYLAVKITTFIILFYNLIRSFDDVLILVGNRFFDRSDDFVARGTMVGRSVDEISAVYLLLALYVHCILECLFGYGTGSSWASDYIVVIVAAWIFRSAPVWSDLAALRMRKKAENAAQKAAADAIKQSLPPTNRTSGAAAGAP